MSKSQLTLGLGVIMSPIGYFKRPSITIKKTFVIDLQLTANAPTTPAAINTKTIFIFNSFSSSDLDQSSSQLRLKFN
jgi:hypothetical protein